MKQRTRTLLTRLLDASGIALGVFLVVVGISALNGDPQTWV